MPFKIIKQGHKYLVKNPESGRVFGRHNTQTKARAQLRALYSNVPEASRARRKKS